MHLQRAMGRLLDYNVWANERLGAWLLTLDRSVLYKDTGSSFGTVDRTLQHMLDAQAYWHAIIFQGQINEFRHDAHENEVDKVINGLRKSSQQLVNSIKLLDENQLLERIKAADSEGSRCEYIIHVVNHGSYHRGQIVSMCRALGVKGEIPVTDYDGYLWWLAKGR